MAWKKLAFTDEILTNPATTNMDMAGFDLGGLSNMDAYGVSGVLYRESSASASRIYLAHSTYAFVAAADADMNTHKLVGLVAGAAVDDAIRKDQAMLLDGTQAMTGDLNMDQNAIKELAFENLASAPHAASEVQGEAYYNTADDHIHVWVV